MTKQRLFEIKITNQVLAILVVFLSLIAGFFVAKDQGWLKKKVVEVITAKRTYTQNQVDLKATSYPSTIEKAISNRRTRRQFQTTPITVNDLSKLAWSLQGITADWGGRVVPTIKSSYPLEISIIIRSVEGVDQGVYHYIPADDQMKMTHSQIPGFLEDLGEKIPSLVDAPVVFVVSVNQSKLLQVVSAEDSINLLYLEAGHAAQNLFLTAGSLSLGVNPISQFDKILVSNGLALPQEETPLYVLPVGYPQEI